MLCAVDESCHEFRHVEHASASDTYYAVGLELACYLQNLLEVVDSRLCQDVLEYLYADTCRLEACQRLFDEGQDRGSRQHHEALQAHLLVIVGECLDAARAENNFLWLQ